MTVNLRETHLKSGYDLSRLTSEQTFDLQAIIKKSDGNRGLTRPEINDLVQIRKAAAMGTADAPTDEDAQGEFLILKRVDLTEVSVVTDPCNLSAVITEYDI